MAGGRYPKFSAETQAAIVERYRSSPDITMAQIGEEFGCTGPTVKRVLRAANVNITNLRPEQNPWKNREPGMPRTFQAPSTIAAITTKRLEGKSAKAIAREVGVCPSTVYKILDSAEIDSRVRQSQSRVAEMLPKALDNLEYHLDQKDKQVSLEIVRGTGALKLTKEGENGNTNSGGVTINLALLNPIAAGQLLASLEGNKLTPVLDAELHDHKGRAGRPEPIQAVPEA